MTDKWKALKLRGSTHYKQGQDKVEPIDLYRDGEILHDFAIGSIIKYAYRNRKVNKSKTLVKDVEKIKHYCDLLVAAME